MSQFSDAPEPTTPTSTAPTPQPGVEGNSGIRVDLYDTINGLIQQNQMLMAQMAMQAQQMLQMQQQMGLLMNMTQQAQNQQAPAPQAPHIKIATPDDFSGKPEELDTFIWQNEMYFDARPSEFPGVEQRVLFTLSHMWKGSPLQWAQAQWNLINQGRLIGIPPFTS